MIWVFFLNCKILFCAVTLGFDLCGRWGRNSYCCCVQLSNNGSRNIINTKPCCCSSCLYYLLCCTQRNHSILEEKTSSSKQTSTKASPNFHFTTCKLDPFLYSKVFSVLFVWVLFLFSSSASSQIRIVTGYPGIASSCTRELRYLIQHQRHFLTSACMPCYCLHRSIYCSLQIGGRGNLPAGGFVVLVSQWKPHMVHESLVAAGLEGSDGVVLFVSVK